MANLSGNVVIIELLRGAKRAQADRFLGDSMVDACRNGVVNHVHRTVTYNSFDPEYRKPSTGMSALCVCLLVSALHESNALATR